MHHQTLNKGWKRVSFAPGLLPDCNHLRQELSFCPRSCFVLVLALDVPCGLSVPPDLREEVLQVELMGPEGQSRQRKRLSGLRNVEVQRSLRLHLSHLNLHLAAWWV